jgi:hypothetical protein
MTGHWSACGPGATFAGVCFRESCRAKPRPGGVLRSDCGSCEALRASSPPLLASRGPPRNSLRSLRSLRSDSLGEFDVTWRAARAATSRCAARRRLRSCHTARPRLCSPPPSLCKGSRAAGIEPAARHDARLRRAARGGLDARCAPRPSTKGDGGLQSRGRVPGGANVRRRAAQCSEGQSNAQRWTGEKPLWAGPVQGPEPKASQPPSRNEPRRGHGSAGAVHEPQLSADGYPPAALPAPTSAQRTSNIASGPKGNRSPSPRC